MFAIDLGNPVKVHFIGIGGVSMSALAELLCVNGFTVTGSDEKKSDATRNLESKGIEIYYGNRAGNIKGDEAVVVYTAAIHPDNPELVAAKSKKIPLLTRAELLGQIMAGYSAATSIAGTHGKTTTTSMLSIIELCAAFDPTILVGGDLPEINGNLRIGQSENFVMEACEYTNSFHSFKPVHEIIMNIEEDHLDFFKDINDIRNSFHTFAKLVPDNGYLLINGAVDDVSAFVSDLTCKVKTFGLSTDKNADSYDYAAADITFDEFGRGSFAFINKGTVLCKISLNVPGLHNVVDALAAAAMAHLLGIAPSVISAALGRFGGAKRRFEKKGELGGILIFDDYSHHPSEIKAALTTAKAYGNHRVVCVFQPHTYSRTKALLHEFADALMLADSVVLAPIFPAREVDPGDISSDDIARLLEQKGKDVHSFPSFGEIEDYLLEKSCPNDLLITMGAGDVVNIGDFLLGK